MDRTTTHLKFIQKYTPMGVVRPTPLVAEVLENKHGMDNPVVDLKINQTEINGFPIVVSSGILTPTRVIFVDSLGHLTDDGNFTFIQSVSPQLILGQSGLSLVNISKSDSPDKISIYGANSNNSAFVELNAAASNVSGGTHLDLFNDAGEIFLSPNTDSFINTFGTFKFKSGASTNYAILDTSLITSSDKTFSFLNKSGTLAILPTTETPSGVINGTNVTYTVTNTIHAIYAFAINGQFIHPSDYTFSGSTITFNTALDSSLSGTQFTIVYV